MAVVLCGNNTYRITPKHDAKGTDKQVSEAAATLASGLVRKSDSGVVLRSDGRMEVMRWGFHRSVNPSINNARSDQLEGAMWKAALRERRCVIPVSSFYEWGAGVGGKKQAYEFQHPDDPYLWIAGIWEEHAELGACFSMVTTDASPVMIPIHDRMLALLRTDEMPGFLDGSSPWNFQPYFGPLLFAPCDSPLAKPKASPDSQLELF